MKRLLASCATALLALVVAMAPAMADEPPTGDPGSTTPPTQDDGTGGDSWDWNGTRGHP